MSIFRLLSKYALKFSRNIIVSLESIFDHRHLDPSVSAPKYVGHQQWQKYLFAIYNKPGVRILEIGSREVTGESLARKYFDQAEYIGFDYYPGRNVDIVGDVHKLSQYFPNEKFDFVFTSACFEHFAMPWIVSVEIAKVLKVGGHVFVESHFSFSSHERPWHFFHFTDMGLRALFPKSLGFEHIDSGMSNPLVGRFSSLADSYLKNKSLAGLYCHCEYYGKKVAEAPSFEWNTLTLDEIAEGTTYPEPKDDSIR